MARSRLEQAKQKGTWKVASTMSKNNAKPHAGAHMVGSTATSLDGTAYSSHGEQVTTWPLLRSPYLLITQTDRGILTRKQV